MNVWVITAGGAIGAGNVWLVAASWKGRAVLPGACGAIGLTLAVLCVIAGIDGRGGQPELVISGIVGLIGLVLYGLGRALWKLLSDDRIDRR